jgi:catechol 2,3-dioxygenase-like lactoylglutathione lyase family enzyme
MSGPSIIQLVLGSNNLPLCKHLYSTVLGFAGAGERLIYSAHNGEIMALGPWGGATVAYMVGRQELMQLEFWNHTTPPQRPLAADWAPNDIGFCRFGIAVPDFDATLERLAEAKLELITKPSERNELRRVCFRDPTVGIPVEVMEDGPGLPGERIRHHDVAPAVVYVALSVADLAAESTFFADVVGLEEVDVELHTTEDESLWGLPHAERRTQVLRGGSTFLELVKYDWPVGRPRPLHDTLNSQGFKTVAVGYRDPDKTRGIFERVKAAGLTWTVKEPASFIGGNHAIGEVAHHMKTLSVPIELERPFGYSPEPQKWWRPPTPTARGTTDTDAR